MRRKIKRVKPAKDFSARLRGFGTYRITGPSIVTGKRVTVEIYGNKEDAEKVILE